MSDEWQRWLEHVPLAPAEDPGGRVVVLSAHPDDEVLAVGAWLAEQADRDVAFVTATDGEGSHPGSDTITRDELRVVRPRELVHALTHLGLVEPEVHRLELPDGGLAADPVLLREALAPFVKDADLVLAPFEADGHPDHDAVGAAAGVLCADGPTLWRFPVWTWAWTEPGDQPWLPLVRLLPATEESRARKRRGIAAFTTQVQPLGPAPADRAVVEGALLRHAMFAPEVVVV